MPRRDVLRELFESHIQTTAPGAVVVDKTVLLCDLTHAVAQAIGSDARKVYATSRFLKHLYDKKPAEEFDFLVDHLRKVVRYPDIIYHNKPSKRGSWCLTKTIGNAVYLAAIEATAEPGGRTEVYTATAFRVRDPNYLAGYELLWSWRDDRPSS
jgi:hypothetical protein